MQAPLRASERHALRRQEGILPGLQAGAAMLLTMGILSLGMNRPFLEPLSLLAGLVTGTGRGGSPLLGLAVHVSASAVFGAWFAHRVGRVGRVRQLGLALGMAIALWLVFQLLLVPLRLPEMAGRPGTLGVMLLGHIAFGAMLGATLPTGGDIDEHRPT